MAKLTREQLIGAAAALKDIEVPELGGEVSIRRLTVEERDAARDSAAEGQIGYAITAASLEEPLMTVDEVRKMPIPAYERIAAAVWDWNNFMQLDDDVKAALEGDPDKAGLAAEVAAVSDKMAGTGDVDGATATFPAGS